MGLRRGSATIGIILLLILFMPYPKVIILQTLPTTGNTKASSLKTKCVVKVELITGDEVYVIKSPNGIELVRVRVANSCKNRAFRVLHLKGDLYVIPNDVNLRVFDKELFNINYLIENGYYNQTYIPVIIKAKTEKQLLTFIDKVSTSFREKVKIKMLSKSLLLSSVKVVANFTKELYEKVLTKFNLERVWLDRKYYVKLDRSVSLIRAPDVWALGYNGSGIIIAILDTGIDYNHPDFYFPNGTSKIIAMESFVEYPEDEIDDPYDYYGHGTHCASIAAGTGAASNGIYKGVAPGAALVIAKVLNREGWGYSSWIIEGIEWAVSQGVHIISMSLSGEPTDGTDPLSMKCNWAVDQGVTVVVAAGNFGDYWGVGTPGVAEKVITVGASDDYDKIADFSSRGPTSGYLLKPDVVAPGVSITAAYPGGGYETFSGTSMATPHVAGLAALVLQRYGPLSPKDVKNIIASTAVFLPGYDVFTQGAGRIDAHNAVNTKVIVDPAVISLRLQPVDKVVRYNITIKNISPQPLSVMLDIDAYTKDGIVDSSALRQSFYIEQGATIIRPGTETTVTLVLNLTSLPWADYEGVIWIFSGGTRLVHAVFSIFKYCKLTVLHYNATGELASYTELLILRSQITHENLFWLSYIYNDSHVCEMYVPSAHYRLMTFYLPANRLYLHAMDINMTGNMYIVANDSKLYPVTFNKPNGAVLLEKYIVTGLPTYVDGNEEWIQASFMWWYPQGTTDYISTNYMVMFKCSYISAEYTNPTYPSLILTPTVFMPWTVLPNVLEPVLIELEPDINVEITHMTFASPPCSVEGGFWTLWEPLSQRTSFSFYYNSPEVLTVKTNSRPKAYLVMNYLYSHSLPGVDIEYFYYLTYVNISQTERVYRVFFTRQPEILMPAQVNVRIEDDALSAIEGYIIATSSDTKDYYWFMCADCQVINHTCRVYANDMLVYEDVSYTPYLLIQCYETVSLPTNLLIVDELWRQHPLSTHIKYSLYYRMLNATSIDINLKPNYEDIGIYIENLNVNSTVVTCDDYHVFLYIANESNLIHFKLYYDYGSGERAANGTLLGKIDRFTILKFTLPSSNSSTYVNIRINITEGEFEYYKSKSYEIYVERAYRLEPMKLLLEDLPYALMPNQIFNATFIIGDTSKHAHTNATAATSDVLGAIRIASSFSRVARRVHVETYVDTHVANYLEGRVMVNWNAIVTPNVVIVGGPGVNYLTLYYNSSLPFNWIFVPSVKSVIRSSLTGREYRCGRDDSERLYDHAIIAILNDTKSGKRILIAWGLSRYGTQAACYVLQKYEEYRNLLEGSAIVIKWIDLNNNRIVDEGDTIELVEKWP